LLLNHGEVQDFVLLIFYGVVPIYMNFTCMKFLLSLSKLLLFIHGLLTLLLSTILLHIARLSCAHMGDIFEFIMLINDKLHVIHVLIVNAIKKMT